MVRVIREKNLFQKFKSNISDFKLFAFLGVFALLIGATFYLTTKQQDIRQHASFTNGTEFGFNTHLSAANNNLDINKFKTNVDTLVQNGQKWIRFNIIDFEVATEVPNIVPTATPTPTPTASPGLLRVETNPAAEATIIVKDTSGQIVQQKTWSIDWISLAPGKYSISYTYPYPTINGQPVVIPPPQSITVYSNQTTTVVADLTRGTETINPNPSSGLLRVETNPAAEATITVTDSVGHQWAQKAWSIDWAVLPIGDYTLTYTYPYVQVNGQTAVIPQPYQISILDGKTTTVIANLTTGTSTTQSVQGISTNAIQWNTANLAIYDQAIEYARTKGLRIFLVTNTPIFAKNYTLDDYKAVTDQFYSYLSQRYSGKISVWQVFNEADTHSFRDYSTLSSLDSNYLADLNSVIAVAKNSIKVNDPAAYISTNSSGYPMNDTTVNKWYQYFDALKNNLDIISVDMYPAPDLVEIAKLGTRVDSIRSRYNKEVAVTETGVCTLPGTYTEDDQANYVTKSINSLKLSNTNIIIIYEIMDEASTSNLCEGLFGIVKTDGVQKSSFTSIMSDMIPLPTLTPTNAPTNTPTPTIIPTNTPVPTVANTPTPTPTQAPTNTGLLRVSTNPPTAATINIINSLTNQIVMTETWGIDWKPLLQGSYYVSFSYPRTQGFKTPKTTLFKEYTGRTTEIVGDFYTGRTTITYK